MFTEVCGAACPGETRKCHALAGAVTELGKGTRQQEGGWGERRRHSASATARRCRPHAEPPLALLLAAGTAQCGRARRTAGARIRLATVPAACAQRAASAHVQLSAQCLKMEAAKPRLITTGSSGEWAAAGADSSSFFCCSAAAMDIMPVGGWGWECRVHK